MIIIVVLTILILLFVFSLVKKNKKTKENKNKTMHMKTKQFSVSNKTKPICYLRYEGRVKVKMDTDNLDIDIDEDNREIKINIPTDEIKIECIVDDVADVIFCDKKYEKKDANAEENTIICQEDMENNIDDETELIEIAKENIKNTLKGLILPSLEQIDKKYKIIFVDN